MIGEIIVMLMFIWAISISLGVILGKLLWSPPVKGA